MCVQSFVLMLHVLQACELRVSKSLIPVVSPDSLSLNLKGLKALKLLVIILKVYLAWFVLTSSIKRELCCFPRRERKFVYTVPLIFCNLSYNMNEMYDLIEQLPS